MAGSVQDLWIKFTSQPSQPNESPIPIMDGHIPMKSLWNQHLRFQPGAITGSACESGFLEATKYEWSMRYPYHWIGLREKNTGKPENPIFNGKFYGVL